MLHEREHVSRSFLSVIVLFSGLFWLPHHDWIDELSVASSSLLGESSCAHRECACARVGGGVRGRGYEGVRG